MDSLWNASNFIVYYPDKLKFTSMCSVNFHSKMTFIIKKDTDFFPLTEKNSKILKCNLLGRKEYVNATPIPPWVSLDWDALEVAS
jgi:hypothetical protein